VEHIKEDDLIPLSGLVGKWKMCASSDFGYAKSPPWFRGGLVFEAHRICVSFNSRLEINKSEEAEVPLSRITSPFSLVYLVIDDSGSVPE